MELPEKRLRIHYSKTGFIRFTSNLDVQRIWERTLRRAGIAVAYSQGFHPQAKIQQASPLPLGFESTVEIVDIWISLASDLQNPSDLLNQYLPDGFHVSQVEYIDISEHSLQSRLFSSSYDIHFMNNISRQDLESLRHQVNNASTILFTKHNGKQYDLKPLIFDLTIQEDDGNYSFLSITLSSQINSTGRPDHLLQSFHIDPALTRIIRTAIRFMDDD